MIKTKVWVSILAAASTAGLVVYAVARRSTSADQVISPLVPASSSALFPVRIAAVVPDDETPSVELLRKAPPLSGADDAEGLDADDLGRDWLARAAQSEPSVSEADLDIVLDDIVDPSAETDITESLEAAESAEV